MVGENGVWWMLADYHLYNIIVEGMVQTDLFNNMAYIKL